MAASAEQVLDDLKADCACADQGLKAAAQHKVVLMRKLVRTRSGGKMLETNVVAMP